MRYGSLCSGIEAASVAWDKIGWKPQFFSEIEPFPNAVLAHHWPLVQNLGDMTEHANWKIKPESVDLLVAGTPCQAFSLAGNRRGLDDSRGNLALVYFEIVKKVRPKWVVWENVPGVLSSNNGRDFCSILGALQELGYGYAYRTLDAKHFGVAQQRRRVFVVGYLGDWRPAAAVLFESKSLCRDFEESKSAEQKASKRIERGVRTWPKKIAPTLNAAFGKKLGLEDQHIGGGGAIRTCQPGLYV